MNSHNIRLRPKKILVTGGAGFIGANLVRMLLQEDCQVTVLDNLSQGTAGYLDGLPVDLIEADLMDKQAVGSSLRGQHAVVHLAAQTGVPGSLEDPLLDCRLNVLGTLNLLEACRLGGQPIPRFVLASSNAPLGKQPPPASEEKAALPISPYGASKLAAEAYCLAYNGSFGLLSVALRFGNVYGPYSAHKGSVVAKFIRQILKGDDIIVDGDGNQTRDFVHVTDICRAISSALESGIGGEVYQIATGRETSILELAGFIQRLAQSEGQISHGPPRAGDILRNFSSTQKVRRELGWVPKIEMEDGLRETLEWFTAST